MGVNPLLVTTGAFVTWHVTVMQIRWLFYFTQSPFRPAPPSADPPICAGHFHPLPNFTQVESLINRHPHFSAFPTPSRQRHMWPNVFTSVPRLSPSILPRSNSFSSRRASLLSRRSCLSISSLIRLASFASSLRQHAIMDSRVIFSQLTHPRAHLFAFSSFTSSFRRQIRLRGEKSKQNEACGSQITSSCRPGCGEITRGRPFIVCLSSAQIVLERKTGYLRNC